MEDGEHEIRLSFAGPSRHYVSWDLSFPLPDEFDSIEIQLLEGPILEDPQHITDYSTISPNDDGSRTLCRYQSISDVLSSDELTRYRGRVCELLEALCGDDEQWILFITGTPIKSEDVNHTDIFVGQIYCDDADGNGAFTIVTARYSMNFFGEHFGCCDKVAGLLAPTDSLAKVLGRLTLDAAMPTSVRYRFAGAYRQKSTEVLQRMFEVGALWFEEIDNGTRLRFVAKQETFSTWVDRIYNVVITDHQDEDEDEPAD